MNDEQMTIDVEPDEPPTSTALTIIRAALPTIIGADKDDLLGKLAEKVRAFQPDISTKKGQDAVRSLAAEADEAYRETRTALDEALAAEATAQAEREKRLAEEAAAEATRRAEEAGARKAEEDAKAAQALLDAAAERERLATAHAKEIMDRAEAARKQAHIDALDILRRLGTLPVSDPPRILIEQRIASLEDAFERNWEEFVVQATSVKEITAGVLTAKLQAASAAEIEAREAEIRRREEAKQTAQREAQAKADAAVEAERQKVAREKAAEDEAAAKRAANVAHQRRINGQVLADIGRVLHEAGISNASLNPEVAKAIVVALAKGAIRHVRIDYSGE